MGIYILIFLFAVIGVFAGLWAGFLICKPLQKNQPPENVSRQRNRKRVEADLEETEIEEKHENILQKKMKKPEVSLLEFSNAADGIEHEEYIKKKQTDEDTAYSILKQKESKT